MNSACLNCGATTETVLDLGEIPQVDRLWPDLASALAAPRHPLVVARCPDCALAQLTQGLPRERLFGSEYRYCSSVSAGVLESARLHALQLMADCGLGAHSLVMEAASNDGYQLRWFAQARVPVLGIEPAPLPAAAASAHGVPVRHDYFSLAVAAELVANNQHADVFLAKNVLAHVPDPHDFLAGVAIVLKPDGVACFEFPSLRNLLAQGQFDTIYHEHRCYLSLTTLTALLRPHGLHVHRVAEIDLHGGSLRVEVKRAPGRDGSAERMLVAEREAGVNDPAAWAELAVRVDRSAAGLHDQVAAVRAKGGKLAAYGAAAKGVVMLDRAGLDYRDLDYVVDLNPHKQGRYMPGSGLPIRDPRVLLQEPPAALVLLAWNHAAEIQREQRAYARQGGRWIVPRVASG